MLYKEKKRKHSGGALAMSFRMLITLHYLFCSLIPRAVGRDLEVGQPKSILLARRGLEV